MEHVQIRLTVEGMRHQVVHAFARHQSEMQEIVEERLAFALDNWRIDDQIDAEIRSVLNETVSRIIEQEVRRVLVHGDVRNALEIAVEDSFRTALAARGLLPQLEKESHE